EPDRALERLRSDEGVRVQHQHVPSGRPRVGQVVRTDEAQVRLRADELDFGILRADERFGPVLRAVVDEQDLLLQVVLRGADAPRHSSTRWTTFQATMMIETSSIARG